MGIELEIRLQGIEPAIWRRIIVPSSIPLDELHAVIQGAMGWQDQHLHMFEIAGQRYEIPESDEMGPEPGYLDERGSLLGEVVSRAREFLYVYDFGDDWRHTIRAKFVEANTEPFPSCIAGERACPPENCGGALDYPEFIAQLSNSNHPDHAETKAWAPAFEPEVFSVSQASSLMAALYTWCRERKEPLHMHH